MEDGTKVDINGNPSDRLKLYRACSIDYNKGINILCVDVEKNQLFKRSNCLLLEHILCGILDSLEFMKYKNSYVLIYYFFKQK